MPNIGLGVTDLDKLEDETNQKRDERQPDGTPPTKKRALSHKEQSPKLSWSQ